MRLVIDTSSLSHRIRRAWTRMVGSMGPGRCLDCNARLTADERHYYETNCERCEGIRFHQQQEKN